MLKRFTLITLASFLAWTMLSGQSIGFEFGAGVRTLLINEELNTDFDSPTIPGLSFGANALIPLGSQKLQIMPAVRYITKGGDLKEEEYIGTGEGKVKYRLNYFEVAPQLLIRFNEEYKGFFLNAGPTLDIGIGGNCTECDGKPEFGSGENDIFNKTNIGIVIGGGLIRTNEETSRTFFTNLVVGIGLADIRTNPQFSDYSGTATNFYIGLNFGYLFPLYTH